MDAKCRCQSERLVGRIGRLAHVNLDHVQTLSINCHHQSIAAAYYDNSTQTLSMLEDTQDSPSFDLLQTCKRRNSSTSGS
jgi:hypothetical protein